MSKKCKDFRQRFMDIMLFKDTTCVPFQEIGLWDQTLDRWEKESIKKGVIENPVFLEGDKYFGFEPREFININCAAPVPLCEYRVLEEDERYIVYIDEWGITHKALKEGTVNGMRLSMDQYIEFPVKDRESFKKWKKCFTADKGTRYPKEWELLKERWKSRDYPLVLSNNGQFGFYSMLRNWMGTEGVSYIFYDDPVLVHEMLEFLMEYFIELTHTALHEVEIDYFNFFEDMSFKNGPLVSPQIFKDFFLPCYKKTVDHLRSHGIKLITVDTDGNPEKLLPYFIEAGVNALWPVEVAAGIDPIILRKEFGNDLALMGGIDKRVLAQGKQEINKEVLRILDYMLPRGGYIPMVDHLVPPEVSYDNFVYYLDIKKRALEG